MATKNIEIFNRIVVLLFSRLYENFPEPIDVDSSAIGLESMPEDEQDDQELWNSMTLGAESITWLEQEGFITFQSRTLDSNFGGVRFTSKGLTLMEMPSVLENPQSESIGEMAKGVIAGTVQETATDLMKRLLWTAVNYAPQMFS